MNNAQTGWNLRVTVDAATQAGDEAKATAGVTSQTSHQNDEVIRIHCSVVRWFLTDESTAVISNAADRDVQGQHEQQELWKQLLWQRSYRRNVRKQSYARRHTCTSTKQTSAQNLQTAQTSTVHAQQARHKAARHNSALVLRDCGRSHESTLEIQFNKSQASHHNRYILRQWWWWQKEGRAAEGK